METTKQTQRHLPRRKNRPDLPTTSTQPAKELYVPDTNIPSLHIDTHYTAIPDLSIPASTPDPTHNISNSIIVSGFVKTLKLGEVIFLLHTIANYMGIQIDELKFRARYESLTPLAQRTILPLEDHRILAASVHVELQSPVTHSPEGDNLTTCKNTITIFKTRIPAWLERKEVKLTNPMLIQFTALSPQQLAQTTSMCVAPNLPVHPAGLRMCMSLLKPAFPLSVPVCVITRARPPVEPRLQRGPPVTKNADRDKQTTYIYAVAIMMRVVHPEAETGEHQPGESNYFSPDHPGVQRAILNISGVPFEIVDKFDTFAKHVLPHITSQVFNRSNVYYVPVIAAEYISALIADAFSPDELLAIAIDTGEYYRDKHTGLACQPYRSLYVLLRDGSKLLDWTPTLPHVPGANQAETELYTLDFLPGQHDLLSEILRAAHTWSSRITYNLLLHTTNTRRPTNTHTHKHTHTHTHTHTVVERSLHWKTMPAPHANVGVFMAFFLNFP